MIAWDARNSIDGDRGNSHPERLRNCDKTACRHQVAIEAKATLFDMRFGAAGSDSFRWQGMAGYLVILVRYLMNCCQVQAFWVGFWMAPEGISDFYSSLYFLISGNRVLMFPILPIGI